MRVLGLALAALAFLAVVTAGAASAQSVAVSGPAGARTLTAADLAALPHVSASLAPEGGGSPHVYQGVALADLLAPVTGLAGPRLHGPGLGMVIVVTGADGYRATYSLAETDPTISPLVLILADRTQAGALDAKEGPLRLVAGGDRRPARSVRNVVAIKVEPAP